MLSILFSVWALSLPAQTMEHDHSHMDHSMSNMAASSNDPEMYLMSLASGTSMNPRSYSMPMIMTRAGSWNLMLMGQGYLVEAQQSGPRGADKLYSTNWGMISAEHKLGRGSLMLEGMFSLEPATVTNRSYPLLFQTGETAYGKALVDAQHPHDFVMGLGVHYARPLGESTMVHVYFAAVGDPALGPVAFPHRASGADIPQATISHHLQDSTHIANNVATLAMQHRWLRVEASSFYGTEPNENRWNIDWGAMNSYSGRVSVAPSANWMAQVSAGRLKDPERQSAPGEDVVRVTASIHYTRPMLFGNAWSTSLIWGRNHNTLTQRNTNSYLAETVYPISKRNFLTGRIELVDKDELLAENRTFRIQAYIVGLTRDLGSWRKLTIGVGGNVSMYGVPAEIQSYYGAHPWGGSVYMRFRLRPPV